MSNHRLVYSTEIGRACPDCGRPQQNCICKKQPTRQTPPAFPADGIIRIRREIQGRKGKAVSVIHGDHRETIREALAQLGLTVKPAGG